MSLSVGLAVVILVHAIKKDNNGEVDGDAQTDNYLPISK